MMTVITILVVIAMVGLKTYELITYKSYKEKLRKMDEEIEKERKRQKEKEEHIFVGSMDTETIIRHVGETDKRKYRSKRPSKPIYSLMAGNRKSGRSRNHIRRNK